MYAGIQNTFIMEAFTAGYVSCSYGIGWVGYVMVAYGIACTPTSYLVGRVREKYSWWPVIVREF